MGHRRLKLDYTFDIFFLDILKVNNLFLVPKTRDTRTETTSLRQLSKIFVYFQRIILLPLKSLVPIKQRSFTDCRRDLWKLISHSHYEYS